MSNSEKVRRGVHSADYFWHAMLINESATDKAACQGIAGRHHCDRFHQAHLNNALIFNYGGRPVHALAVVRDGPAVFRHFVQPQLRRVAMTNQGVDYNQVDARNRPDRPFLAGALTRSCACMSHA